MIFKISYKSYKPIELINFRKFKINPFCNFFSFQEKGILSLNSGKLTMSLIEPTKLKHSLLHSTENGFKLGRKAFSMRQFYR